jgi:hypothetical protein
VKKSERVELIFHDAGHEPGGVWPPAPELVEPLLRDSGTAVRCYARVESEDNDDRILLSISMDIASLPTVEVGAKLLLVHGTEDGLFVYSTAIFSLHGSRIVVSKPAIVKRVQRRSHCRVPLEGETRFSKQVDIAGAQFYPANLRNLSAGGICFLTEEQLEVNDAILVDVPLEKDVLRINCVVRRIIAEPESPVLVGAQFVDLSSKDEDRIMDFVFATQIRLRKEKQEKQKEMEQRFA